jgi:DNA-binding transcriptional MocR family regulator
VYAKRRAAVVNALAKMGVTVGGSDGINIWVPVAEESAAIVLLASQGRGATPGSPFGVLPMQSAHIRVTVGLLSDRHGQGAEQLAAAARTGGWSRPSFTWVNIRRSTFVSGAPTTYLGGRAGVPTS